MLSRFLSNEIRFGDKIYNLNLSFDNVLRVFELQEDKEILKTVKIDIMLSMLVKNKIKDMHLSDKITLLGAILKDYILPKSDNKKESTQKSLDFKQDANYIYVAFYRDYKIDLQNEIGKLDWRKFYALFQGLGEDNMISKIISIRTQKIPVKNKYNAEQVDAIVKAKQTFKLENTVDNFEEEMDKLGAQLASIAKRS